VISFSVTFDFSAFISSYDKNRKHSNVIGVNLEIYEKLLRKPTKKVFSRNTDTFTTAQGGFRSLGIDDFNFDFRRFSSFSEAGAKLFRISIKF